MVAVLSLIAVLMTVIEQRRMVEVIAFLGPSLKSS
jgi:hypothetical protein